MEKHFSDPDFVCEPSTFHAWRESPFLTVNFSLDDSEQVQGYGSFLITPESSAKELIAGKLHEEEVQPYTPGSTESCYLFWLTLIFEDRSHSPYLIRSLFKELEANCKKWKINLTHVYAIAYSKVSERLMRRYKFEKAGLYQGKYPIMVSRVLDNPYLKAVIPLINTQTYTPWA